MINALKAVFPQAEVLACFFHLQQSFRREIGSLGLRPILDENPHIDLQFKMLCSLAFVPIDQVQEVYALLVRRGIIIAELNPFLDYFEEWYIGTLDRAGNRGDGRFSINNWNVYQRSLQGNFFFAMRKIFLFY